MQPDALDVYRTYTLQQKWDLVDEVKQNSSVDDYYDRIARALELMISQGVAAIGSFVDVDSVAKDRALKAALKAKAEYQSDIQLVLINQVIKGVLEPEERKWFDLAVQEVDIIGGLPGRDERVLGQGKGSEHLDVLFEAAKLENKMVHVHVDQFNSASETETELLADKTLEHGLQGKVVGVHGISIAAHDQTYRQGLYAKLAEAGVMIVSCPLAWLDNPRKEERQPVHNALTPIDELIPAGITVGIGTDNLVDYMVPWCEGSMWQELLVMAVGNRFLDLDALVDVATTNGRAILGLTDK